MADKTAYETFILEEGCRRFGVDPGSLSALNSPDVFSMNMSSRPIFGYWEDGQEYVLKFGEYAPEQFAAACEIAAFVDYLAERGARVCRPLPSREGSLVEGIGAGGNVIAVTKMKKASGAHIAGQSEQVNDAFFREWGRTLGQLHALAKAYTGGPHVDNWQDEIEGIAGLAEAEDVRTCWYEVGRAFQDLPQPLDAYGLVHNDLHPENFLFDQGRITVLDFDVCHRHWFVLDIAMAMYVVGTGMVRPAGEQQGEALIRHCFETLMAGYDQENHLDSFWIHQMPLFLRHRMILPYLLYEKGMIERRDPVRDPWRKAILAHHQLVRPEMWLAY